MVYNEYAVVGPNIARYEPTPKLRWFSPNGATVERLQQWFEASADDESGVRHTMGEWRNVPTEHTN